MKWVIRAMWAIVLIFAIVLATVALYPLTQMWR